jgi:hypothetical protein
MPIVLMTREQHISLPTLIPEKPVGVEAYRQSGSAHVAAMAILRGDEAFKSIAFSSEWFGRGAAAGVVNPFLLKSRYVLASPEVLAFRYH